MIWAFDAHAPLFGLGWFVESLSTQSLVIFPIRTRRIPFFHSRPSTPLVVATAICVTIGVALPYSPLAHVLGFTALPVSFLAALVAMIIVYFGLVELGTRRFCRIPSEGVPIARPRPDRKHSIHRRASRWTTHTSSRHPIPAHVP
jgi:Mg2+-importing ATPase